MSVEQREVGKRQKIFTHQDFLDGKCTANGLELPKGYKPPVSEEQKEAVQPEAPQTEGVEDGSSEQSAAQPVDGDNIDNSDSNTEQPNNPDGS